MCRKGSRIPFQECSIVDQREEFCRLACVPGQIFVSCVGVSQEPRRQATSGFCARSGPLSSHDPARRAFALRTDAHVSPLRIAAAHPRRQLAPRATAGQGRDTAFGLWLIDLGVRIMHGRPWHPQTQGKEERFHRILKTELLDGYSSPSIPRHQRAFDSPRHARDHRGAGISAAAPCPQGLR